MIRATRFSAPYAKPQPRFGLAKPSPVAPLPLDGFSVQSSLQPLSGRKILIVTETYNQMNGVSTTVAGLVKELEKQGDQVNVLHSGLFPALPIQYPDMRISNPVGLKRRVRDQIESIKPDRIVILTEGPLGWAARNYCQSRNIPFSTSYSIKWDDYLSTHYHVPKWLTMRMLRKFHEKAQAVLVITPSLMEDLSRAGFKNLVLWRQAVDVERFQPATESEREKFVHREGLQDRPRPFYLYVGRVSAEKNIEAFLNADLPGTKIVVGPQGAGMSLERLQAEHPDVRFVGPKRGQDLSQYYSGSDVFVFPSKSDTLGLVMLEALASGLPVVGFDVTGPKDVLPPGSKAGFLAATDAELRSQAMRAWELLQSGQISRTDCRELAMTFSWPQCVQTMMANLKTHFWKSSDNGGRANP